VHTRRCRPASCAIASRRAAVLHAARRRRRRSGRGNQRLLFISSHLDTRITNTIPQQMNLPQVVSQNWTMDIGSACLAETPGAMCPPPAPLPSQSRERLRMRRTSR
jgi:hypothetical protein